VAAAQRLERRGEVLGHEGEDGDVIIFGFTG